MGKSRRKKSEGLRSAGVISSRRRKSLSSVNRAEKKGKETQSDQTGRNFINPEKRSVASLRLLYTRKKNSIESRREPGSGGGPSRTDPGSSGLPSQSSDRETFKVMPYVLVTNQNYLGKSIGEKERSGLVARCK